MLIEEEKLMHLEESGHTLPRRKWPLKKNEARRDIPLHASCALSVYVQQ